MRPLEIAVVIGWFVLAAYVMYRCFYNGIAYTDVVFAAWCGGVLSTVCFLIVRRARTRRATP